MTLAIGQRKQKQVRFDIVKKADKGNFYNDPDAHERMATVEEAMFNSSLYRKVEVGSEIQLQDGKVIGTPDGNKVVS